jgi:hypothetical protein
MEKELAVLNDDKHELSCNPLFILLACASYIVQRQTEGEKREAMS